MDIGKAGKTGKNKGFRLGQDPGGVPIDQDGLAISAHAMTEEEIEEQKSGKRNRIIAIRFISSSRFP